MAQNVYLISFDAEVNPDARLALKDAIGEAVRETLANDAEINAYHMTPLETLPEASSDLLGPLA
jgi:hypothetical protein